MKLERKKEEWTLRGEIEEQIPVFIVFFCVWLVYTLWALRYPEKAISEFFVAFINIFVNEKII